MALHWIIVDLIAVDKHRGGERELIEREMLWMHVWNSRQSWISWCYRISISKWTIGPGAVSVVSADPREFSSKMNLTRGRLLTRRRVICRYIYIHLCTIIITFLFCIISKWLACWCEHNVRVNVLGGTPVRLMVGDYTFSFYIGLPQKSLGLNFSLTIFCLPENLTIWKFLKYFCLSADFCDTPNRTQHNELV